MTKQRGMNDLGISYLMSSILEAGSDRPQTAPFSISDVWSVKVVFLQFSGFADGGNVEWLLQ